MRGDDSMLVRLFCLYAQIFDITRGEGKIVGYIAESDVHGITFLMFLAWRRYGVQSGARNDTKILCALMTKKWPTSK